MAIDDLNAGVNLPAQGAVGTPPPPGAPIHDLQPLASDLISEQLARASANEKQLAPLTYSDSLVPPTPLRRTDQQIAALPPQTSAATTAAPDAVVAGPEPPVLTSRRFRPAATMASPTAPVQPAPPPILPHQKAASNTDSPSRGQPRLSDDPGKQITGGFGSVGEAQYYPLDGNELRQVVEGLAAQLVGRIQNDLRFHIAITYPRVRARVVLEVDGWNNDAGFEIAYVHDHTKTPLAVARERAELQHVCFVVMEQRQEFDAADQPVDPPDRMRDEFNMIKPQKTTVPAGAMGRMIVDRVD